MIKKEKKTVTTKKATKTKTPASTTRLKKIKDSSDALCKAVIDGMKEKKAEDIVCLDLRNIKNAFTDFFVICHANSKVQIEAIGRSIEEIVEKKTGEEPVHKEGYANAEWILLDYTNIIAHVFQKEKRDFFGIERLWADAEIKKIA